MLRLISHSRFLFVTSSVSQQLLRTGDACEWLMVRMAIRRAEKQTRAQKLCSADEAVQLIEPGTTIVCGGFVGAAHPVALVRAIERRFVSTGDPCDLTLVYAAGQGDGQTRGLNRLAHVGLLRRVIGGHWGLVPQLGKLALDNQIEAYNFPQGVICQLLRDIAAGRPGCITHVGLGTFIDPTQSGGKLNERTTESLVQRVDLDGRTWLWYKSFPIHVGLIRATAADSNGGLIMENEAVLGEVLAIAQAVRNCGGIVLAQVERLLNCPAPPHAVRVPGILVNHIVVSESGEHDQTFAESFNPSYCNAFREPANLTTANWVTANQTTLPSTTSDFDIVSESSLDDAMRSPDERAIIAARACDELQIADVANLGIGMPEGISSVAAARGLLHECTLTVESGPIGGMPASGLSFGAATYPHAIIDQPAQFDFYDGGGLDYAALGAAQIDRLGNVNVSKFGERLAGVGGFVNIAQNARKLVFCGTFTAGGLQVHCADGKLKIIREGCVKKFVESVDQVCFAATAHYRRSDTVLYVTERAVFQLSPEGVELIEVAPGIDIESQVLALMDFRPIMRSIRAMPAHCFRSVQA